MVSGLLQGRKKISRVVVLKKYDILFLHMCKAYHSNIFYIHIHIQFIKKIHIAAQGLNYMKMHITKH